MAKSKPLTNEDGEVRELTKADLAKMVGFEELPAAVRRAVGQRGPQKTPTKVPVTIRLSREVVSRFRESGSGWQTRMDDALKAWLQRHNP
jgi:uncharacterized protein (DUF4415 family)